MTAIVAKTFITMTLVFELITLTAGAALYPVFTATFCIIFTCLAIQFTVNEIQKITDKKKAADEILSAC